MAAVPRHVGAKTRGNASQTSATFVARVSVGPWAGLYNTTLSSKGGESRFAQREARQATILQERACAGNQDCPKFIHASSRSNQRRARTSLDELVS